MHVSKTPSPVLPTHKLLKHWSCSAGDLPVDWGLNDSLPSPVLNASLLVLYADPLVIGLSDTEISGSIPSSWGEQLPGFGGLEAINTSLTGACSAPELACQ